MDLLNPKSFSIKSRLANAFLFNLLPSWIRNHLQSESSRHYGDAMKYAYKAVQYQKCWNINFPSFKSRKRYGLEFDIDHIMYWLASLWHPLQTILCRAPLTWVPLGLALLSEGAELERHTGIFFLERDSERRFNGSKKLGVERLAGAALNHCWSGAPLLRLERDFERRSKNLEGAAFSAALQNFKSSRCVQWCLFNAAPF